MRTLPPSLRRALEQRGEALTLVVVRLGALGDILRTTPPVRLLRRALPRARIFWLLEERWRVALEGHADLDGLVCMPRREWNGLVRSPASWPALLGSVRGFASELRALGADLVLDFHGNLRSGVAGRLSGAAVRLGYAGHQQKEGNRWLNTHHVASGGRRTPRMERNLDLVRALGLPDGPLPPADLPLLEAGHARAAEIAAAFAAGGHPFAVIAPGASAEQSYKKPPAEVLAAAACALAARGVAVLVVWGPGEEADARKVVESARGAARLAPPTDLRTLAALLARTRLFVGGDSGPLHLACAVGCPVLGIYGPTDPEVNRPWGVPYRTLAPPGRIYSGIKRRDRLGGGFEGLEPAGVEAALEALIGETAGSRRS